MGKVKDALGRAANWEPRPDSMLDAQIKNVRTLLVLGLLGAVAWGYSSVSSRIEATESIQMCEGDIEPIFDAFFAIGAEGLEAERAELPLTKRFEGRRFHRQVLDMIESGQCRIEGEHVIVEIEGLPPYRINLEDLAEYMCKGLCVTDQDFILRRLGLVGLGIAGVAVAVGAGFLAKKGLENYSEKRRIEKARPRHQVIGEHVSPVIIVEPQVKPPPTDKEILDLLLKGELELEDIQEILQEAVEKGRQKEAGRLVQLLVDYHRAKERPTKKPTT